MVFVFHRFRPILGVGNIRSSVLGRHPIVVLCCCCTLLHVLLTDGTTESVVDVVEAFPVSSPIHRARIPATTTLSAMATTNIMLAVLKEEGTNGATATAAAAAPGLVETTTTAGDTVGPSLGSVLFLAYVVFSLGAGIKYIVVDGWRPKL